MAAASMPCMTPPPVRATWKAGSRPWPRASATSLPASFCVSCAATGTRPSPCCRRWHSVLQQRWAICGAEPLIRSVPCPGCGSSGRRTNSHPAALPILNRRWYARGCACAAGTRCKLQRDAVLPHAHAFGLGALVRHLLDELHHVTFLQLIEGYIHQIVETEIELAAVGTPDEAVGFLGNQTRHQAGVFLRMGLGLAAHALAVILQLASGRIEGVTQGDIHVFVPVAVHDDLAAWHADGDAHVEEFALILVLVRHFHHHPAGHDRLEKRLQLLHSFADMRLNGIGAIDIAKRDLQGWFHLVSLYSCCE